MQTCIFCGEKAQTTLGWHNHDCPMLKKSASGSSSNAETEDARKLGEIMAKQTIQAIIEPKNGTVFRSLEKECPLDSGKKFDNAKPDMSLLSTIAVTKIAEVMTFGKAKYDAHNWRKGLQYSRLLAAALRHIFAYLGGETLDAESGKSHLAHASCCLMMLLEFETTRPELDDRYKP